MSERKRKEMLPVGSRNCLKGVFDALTQYGVNTAPVPFHCKAFVHSSSLDLTFSLDRVPHSDMGKDFMFTRCPYGGGSAIRGTKTMRDAYHIAVRNKKAALEEIKAKFGDINSPGLVGLSSNDVKVEIEFECSGPNREMLNNMDGDSYTYVAYPSEIMVKLRFLSSLGWVRMEGEIPLWAREKEFATAVHEGEKHLKLQQKLGINWSTLSFSPEDQNFPFRKASRQ